MTAGDLAVVLAAVLCTLGFAALVVLRLALGLGESAAFPCGSKLLARLPPRELGRANGLVAVCAFDRDRRTP